jgi:hypothetical protein
LHLEPPAVAQQVEARPRQLVRDRLESHQARLVRSVALVPATDGGVEADCGIGGLDPRPSAARRRRPLPSRPPRRRDRLR